MSTLEEFDIDEFIPDSEGEEFTEEDIFSAQMDLEDAMTGPVLRAKFEADAAESKRRSEQSSAKEGLRHKRQSDAAYASQARRRIFRAQIGDGPAVTAAEHEVLRDMYREKVLKRIVDDAPPLTNEQFYRIGLLLGGCTPDD